jgi:hypothetical protein
MLNKNVFPTMLLLTCLLLVAGAAYAVICQPFHPTSNERLVIACGAGAVLMGELFIISKLVK